MDIISPLMSTVTLNILLRGAVVLTLLISDRRAVTALPLSDVLRVK